MEPKELIFWRNLAAERHKTK
ncbi:hypothetical protein [Bartonella australis]|nr:MULTISPECIES: hypothetical protein [Bartonella]